ncbi:glycosyltransferase family 2 protein [Clostridium bowmanii]|uniref:glycosyltransferase family 2 protein n=1 Tax=Clostridium bowmanii TaxID=132925 RepID=UPI001C0D0212|nr:glycosyltransferase family 2 protein [Clostridium bowmanii]MBU3191210.1 glycosyltransferase family 2 protein [Clostridium bowmanii]MCA1075658.1 glycosyltransferase family 2 protein [Clostridium bowmanii]
MNNLEPLIYIILLNYNGYKDTIECVRSIEKINYENYKLVIVDNNSKDGSEEIFKKKLQKYKIIQTNCNKGFAGGNNIGIKYAVYEGAQYVLLLNNDTLVEAEFLTNLMDETLKEEDKPGISIGKIYYNSGIKKIWYAGGGINYLKGESFQIGCGETDDGKYDRKKNVDFATGCMMLINKEVIEKVGYLSEDYFLYYEDTDYCMKVSKAGYKILYCPKSVIYHKVSASTVALSEIYQFYMCRNRYLFIKRNFKDKYRVIATIYTNIYMVHCIFNGRYNFKNVIKAIKSYHFFKGKNEQRSICN